MEQQNGSSNINTNILNHPYPPILKRPSSTALNNEFRPKRLNSTTQNQNNKIDSLMAQISAATKSLECLTSTNMDPSMKLALSSIQTCLKVAELSIEQIKVEIKQNSAAEQERARSLVFLGVSEAEGDKASLRAKKDISEVEDILDALDIQCVPNAVYRMGRRDKNNKFPRLLKVILPASVYQHMSLGSWKRNRDQMRKQDKWHHLLIRPSLSPEQLRLERAERDRRNFDRLGALARQMETDGSEN